MESLPEELIELIAQHLTARDLSRCCAVSPSWRNKFGHSRLWKPHCNGQLVSYLTKTERVVETDFLNFTTSGSKLSDLSEWRLNFMKEACLRNNYQEGKYKIDYYPHHRHEFFILRIIYKNDYFLKFKNDTIEVWDIKDKLTLHLCLPFRIHSFYPVHMFEVTESDKIVVVQGNIVRVFSLCLVSKSISMNHLFSYLEPEKCQDNSDAAVEEMFRTQVIAVSDCCEVIKNTLVAVSIEGHRLTLHIWNVDTGEKIKKEECPFNLVIPVNTYFKCCKETMNVIIHVEDLKGFKDVIGYYCVYSVNNLVFLPFSVSHKILKNLGSALCEHDCIILGDFCAIQLGNTLYVYNYRASKLLYETVAKGFLGSLQNNIVYENEKVWTVIEPSCKTEMAKFNVNIQERYMHITRVINNSTIFVFELGMKVYISCMSDKVKNENPITLLKVCSVEEVLVNNAGTKLILYDYGNLVVVNFW